MIGLDELWLAIREDARFAFKSLARVRTYTATVVLTLALAIGGVTAVFSVLYAVVLRPLPFPKAEELVTRALELEPRLRTGRYNLARIREARGDARGAEELYRAELETYPDNGRAWFNLAQMRRARGDREGYLRSKAVLKQLNKSASQGSAPNPLWYAFVLECWLRREHELAIDLCDNSVLSASLR